MSYIDRLLHRWHHPDEEPDDLDERMARWMNMSIEKRNELIGKAHTMHWVLDLVEDGKRAQTSDGLTWLPQGKAQQALDELGIKTRATLHETIDKCRSFRAKRPDQPLAYALINMAGRPPNQLLSLEEQLFALGAYANTTWQSYSDDGIVYENTTRVRSIYIYEWLCHVFPSVSERLKPAVLERFLDLVVAEDEATFTLAWEGEKEVWKRFLLKLPNNITEPNQVWQLDGRVLPFVVYSDGIPCTVTLIPLVDVFSTFTPSFVLTPRKAENELGDIQKVDFRYHHVTKLLAIVMLMLKLRPGFLYTDNGSQFKALERILSYLVTHTTEEEVSLVRGFPGHPWGRGIVEVVQKLADEVLREQPGFVHDENDLASWNKAYEKAKLSVDDLNTLLKRHFKKWNDAPRGDQPSRFDIWKNTPQTRRPMPSPERIFHLGFGTDWKKRLVRDTHIEYDNTYWHLKKLDDESRMRWVDAVEKSVPIWSMEYYDDMQGRNIKRVFVCLDGRTMDELIKGKTPGHTTPSPQQRKKNQRGELDVIKRREKALDDVLLSLLEKHGTSIPALDTPEKTIIFFTTVQKICTNKQ